MVGISIVTVGCALLAFSLGMKTSHPGLAQNLLIASIISELVGVVIVGLSIGMQQPRHRR